MASLGRIEVTVQDTTGAAKSGVAVEVRRQGAQISGAQGGSPYTVDAINGVVVGDTVVLNTSSSPLRNVSAISGTTVTTSGGDLGAVSDDDRISIASTLPTIYEDADGHTSIGNPMTTGSTGRAGCYITGGRYDVLLSGGGVATTLLQDQVAIGGETVISNIYTTGSAVAYQFDTLRTLVGGDKLVSFKHGGSEVFNLKPAGATVTGTLAVSGTATVTGASTLTGAVTAQSTLAVTGATTLSGAATTTGITNTGAISTTTDYTGRRLLLNQGSTLTGSDFAISGGWGATATVGLINRGIDPDATDSTGIVVVTTAGGGYGANPTITLNFKDPDFVTAPIAIVQRALPIGASTDQLGAGIAVQSALDQWIATVVFTPIGGQSYCFQYLVVR